MAKVLGRMKNLFKRDPRPQNLPPGSFPNPVGNGETLGTITKTPYQTDDDDNEDAESLRNYNVPEQTRLKGQPRDSNQSDNNNRNWNPYGTPSPAANNPLNPQPRGPTVTFRADMPTNNNNPRPPFGPNAPNAPLRPGFPFPPPNQPGAPTPLPGNLRPPFGGFPPGMNRNQATPSPSTPPRPSSGFPPSLNPSPTPPPINSQPPSNGLPPGLNPNLPPPMNNIQSSSNGFLPGIDSNQTLPPPSSNNPPSALSRLFGGMNTNQTTPNPPPSFPGFPSGGTSQGIVPSSNYPNNSQQDNPPRSRPANDDENLSRLELDYPIENVLIDANIPSAMAIKINDVVEQDRLGNAYRVHRYTFEPSGPQHMSFKNKNPPGINSSFRGGTRQIREIQNNHQHSSPEIRSRSHHPTRRPRQRHDHHHSTTTLEQYIDQILRTPGSTVIQAQNSNDLHQILNQHLFYPQVMSPQPSYTSYPSNLNSYNEVSGPVFYYTARALYDDPMRRY